MQLLKILAEKPIQGIEAISEHETLSGLVARLAEKKIGCLVVTSNGELTGIISERDVIGALSEGGGGSLSDPVRLHMTPNPQTAKPEDYVSVVLARMTTGRFRHMPVLSDGALVGMVSIGDLVKAQIDALKAENAALEEFIRS